MKQNIFFSQSMIALISDITQSTISRYISNNHIEHVSGTEKRKKYSFENVRNIMKALYSDEMIVKKQIQVFFNFKGGTGKTSLCYQTSILFSLLGFKVLVLDCDPQGHLSYSFGFSEEEDKMTLYDVIVNKVGIEETIKPVYPGLDIIPANISLTRLELPINQMPNREKVLSKILEGVRQKYDFIFIDTNPTISTVNRNATLVADVLNVVCETQYYSLKGLEILMSEIDDFSDAMEKKINYVIIPNKYESKTATSQEVLGTLRKKYGSYVMESIIRKCEDINISAKKKLPVIGFCNKRSIAVEDVLDLTKEMLKKSTINKQGVILDEN
ncbi:ParA family protein (plasmid) [Candidatus Bandiella numerosa]|uniref:ParA family protein n=1 Tax=Candidatus Bandiella numerosa TaxID=2570586 RepID=UPI00249DEF6A|nr:ParA family protein [Candidatus Bandiella numerosa]WHA05640.1 ParA family protein [Candidatus Bandiella numerosa]